LGDLPVGPPAPGGRAGRGVRPDLALDRLFDRQQLAPGAYGDVGVFAADRHFGIGRFRDAQEEVRDLGFDSRELRVDGLDATAGLHRGGLQLRDLVAVWLRPALDRLADPLARGVPLGLQRVALAEERPPAGVQLQGAIDDRRVLALVDGAPPDRVGVVTEPLQPDAHAGTWPAAARSRSRTKSRSSEASSQPARGPLARPRNAA